MKLGVENWRNLDWRRTGRILVRLVAGLVAVPVVYFLAAVLLGLVPANPGWREAQAGVTIYIRTNGVHTWIMMPKVNPEMDWRPFAPPEHLGDPRYGYGDHVAIGYGNREFYLNTPTWADLTLRNAFGALVGGGRTLLHVEHDHQPQPNAWQRPITLAPAEYRRLTEFIKRRFRLDAQGRPVPLLGRGYNDWDMFYEAQGGYSFVLTCNEWTGRALRAAGIRTGLWTPLEQSIMWRLD
ncbi:MAG TPA: TIGR02117 family protein [Allosphingosinicella sp.]|nr:TIGR02117 family protein [Allosphingosinicella sp.]